MSTFAEQSRADIEQALARDTGEGYDRIFEAARYSLLAGGKRLRPMIVLAFCRLCGGQTAQALSFACALEMIHTYSLIHDDLPCMDDDDLRRGRPSCHRAFDEVTAVLAGDGLLTAAFETAAEAPLPAETVLAGIRCLGRAAGMNGMIAGQVLDLGAEHRQIELDALRLLQDLKTGCLLRAACELGCIAAGRQDADTLAAARRYGEKLGLAFQIQDDILDIEGDAAALGKTVGKDARDEKSTFPALLGLEDCRALVRELTDEAVAALPGAPADRAFLTELAYSLVGRTN
ncbi:MAG: polyprenyl synthetase family protein [Eubacteriales bacterium]|nr:polyprenyl synthetase family protein [Eubacteriales bacterium]